MKWPSGYYDGPLSGICEYQGSIYYFECCGEEDLVQIDWDTREVEYVGSDRFYHVRKIPWWVVAFECFRHGMFNLLVRKICAKWSMWLWYDLKKLYHEDYDKYEIIGWCADDKAFFKKKEKRPKQWRFFWK